MWLADTSVKRPVFATMVIMALVVLGVVSYPSIGVDLFPKIDFPIVTITTTLKGASPDVMDVDVTDRIEGAVNTINGVKTITSTSYESMSRTNIEFVLERDIDQAVRQIFSSLFAAITREERIDLRGFGNLTVRHRSPKRGRNPKTGSDIAVGHRRVVFFKAGKELTRKING